MTYLYIVGGILLVVAAVYSASLSMKRSPNSWNRSRTLACLSKSAPSPKLAFLACFRASFARRLAFIATFQTYWRRMSWLPFIASKSSSEYSLIGAP